MGELEHQRDGGDRRVGHAGDQAGHADQREAVQRLVRGIETDQRRAADSGNQPAERGADQQRRREDRRRRGCPTRSRSPSRPPSSPMIATTKPIVLPSTAPSRRSADERDVIAPVAGRRHDADQRALAGEEEISRIDRTGRRRPRRGRATRTQHAASAVHRADRTGWPTPSSTGIRTRSGRDKAAAELVAPGRRDQSAA